MTKVARRVGYSKCVRVALSVAVSAAGTVVAAIDGATVIVAVTELALVIATTATTALTPLACLLFL